MKKECKAYLAEQFGGDEDVMNELYGEYVQSAGVKMKEAHSALGKADWKQLDQVAHAMKGNALAVGDKDMAEAAISLRNAAKLNEAKDAANLLAIMDGLMAGLD